MTNPNLLAIQGALTLLGKSSTVSTTSSSVVPTAKTRSVLDLLATRDVQHLTDNHVDLRMLSEGLFNWTDKPKSSKALMRELGKALNTPDKYPHAVELTAYIAALTPLLDSDRLARLFGAINEVSTAYAPARYTLQLSVKLKKLFSNFSQERIEKLAYSLWVESHQGRWWDITAGQAQVGILDDQEEAVSKKELYDAFCAHSLTWTRQHADFIKSLNKRDENIVQMLDEYNHDLLREKIVDPDTALLASYISWLKPLERPESPVGSLLNTLSEIMEAIEYDLPEKPKKFSELFPNIKLYGTTQFPFPQSVLNTHGKKIVNDKYLMEIVLNSQQLADNRTYMGNCTWSYKDSMEKGKYVLYRIRDEQGNIYNGAMHLVEKNRQWHLREINSRFNRGDVPADLRAGFTAFIHAMPALAADTPELKAIEHNKRVQEFAARKYQFRL